MKRLTRSVNAALDDLTMQRTPVGSPVRQPAAEHQSRPTSATNFPNTSDEGGSGGGSVAPISIAAAAAAAAAAATAANANRQPANRESQDQITTATTPPGGDASGAISRTAGSGATTGGDGGTPRDSGGPNPDDINVQRESDQDESEVRSDRKAFRSRNAALMPVVVAFNRAIDELTHAVGGSDISEITYRYDELEKIHATVRSRRKWAMQALSKQERAKDIYLNSFQERCTVMYAVARSRQELLYQEHEAEKERRIQEARLAAGLVNIDDTSADRHTVTSLLNTGRSSPTTVQSSNEEEERERRLMEKVLDDNPTTPKSSRAKKLKRGGARSPSVMEAVGSPSAQPSAMSQTKLLVDFMAQQAVFAKEAAERAERFQENQTKVMEKMFLTAQSKKFDVKEMCPIFESGSSKEFLTWFSRWQECERILLKYDHTQEQLYFTLTGRLKGNALDTATAQLVTAESYKEAINKLKTAYLDRQKFLQELMLSITSFPKMVDNETKLLKNHNTLVGLWDSFKNLELNPEQMKYLFFMAFIEPKISSHTHDLWQTIKAEEYKKNPDHPLGGELTVQMFFDTMMTAKRDAGASSNRSLPAEDQKSTGGAGGGRGRHSTLFGSQLSQQQQQAGNDDLCVFCLANGRQEKKHARQLYCKSLKNLGPELCWKVFKQYRIDCKLCLTMNHYSKNCPGLLDGEKGLKPCGMPLKLGSNKGQKCGALHCTFLHFEKDKKRNDTQQDDDNRKGGHGGHNSEQSLHRPPPPPQQHLVKSHMTQQQQQAGGAASGPANAGAVNTQVKQLHVQQPGGQPAPVFYVQHQQPPPNHFSPAAFPALLPPQTKQ